MAILPDPMPVGQECLSAVLLHLKIVQPLGGGWQLPYQFPLGIEDHGSRLLDRVAASREEDQVVAASRIPRYLFQLRGHKTTRDIFANGVQA